MDYYTTLFLVTAIIAAGLLIWMETKSGKKWLKGDFEEEMETDKTTNIFNDEQRRKSEYILSNEYSKFSSLAECELQELECVWCFFTEAISGNRYTYVETESLIKDGITAEKKFDDAMAIIDTDKTFQRELKRTYHAKSQPHINKQTGNPLELAVFMHCNLMKMCSNTIGIERTVRMVEAIVLLNADLIPPYSTRKESIAQYHSAIEHFRKTGDYGEYSDFFLDMLINRLL